MKKKLILAFVCIVLSGMGFVCLKCKETIDASEALQFQSVDIKKMTDGSYVGECETGLVQVVIEVTIKDGQLRNMTLLKHDHGLGGRAEEILDVMIKENQLDVDAVSGATISSRAIRKASETALLSKERRLPIS